MIGFPIQFNTVAPIVGAGGAAAIAAQPQGAEAKEAAQEEGTVMAGPWERYGQPQGAPHAHQQAATEGGPWARYAAPGAVPWEAQQPAPQPPAA